MIKTSVPVLDTVGETVTTELIAPVASRQDITGAGADRVQDLVGRKAIDRHIEVLEDTVFEDSLRVIGAALKFADIDSPDPPAEWVDEYGDKEARVRHRIATFATMNAKDAPVALKLAATTLIGLTKARAMRGAAPKSLNVQLVQMSAPLPTFPVREIEEK